MRRLSPLALLLFFPLILSAETPPLEVSPAVAGFIRDQCLKCHGAEKQKGDIRLDTLDPGLGDPASAQLWQDVLDIINIGDMPPEDEERPNDEQLAMAAGVLTKDFGGSRLFDNCLVSYGSNIRTGHMLKNVPAFLTRNVKGRITHGKHIELTVNTALCNLWLTLSNRSK